MKAENTTIENWIHRVRTGEVLLPRFQRDVVWTSLHVVNFLESVIQGNAPLGVLMILRVDADRQPFSTRPLQGTPDPSSKCNFHLLDGQQRLTALWRSMNDNYEDRTFFVHFKEDYTFYKVASEGKVGKNSSLVNDPTKQLERGCFPVRLLLPGQQTSNILKWSREATSNNQEQDRLTDMINDISNCLAKQYLPCLELAQKTSADAAIGFFVRVNTSFVKLTHYDIAVAQFEAGTSGKSDSLRDMVNELKDKVPDLTPYVDKKSDIGDMMLKITCLMQEKKPTYGNYKDLDFKRLQKDKDDLFKGVEWTVNFMRREKILDGRRLPSAVPLRVLPALHQYVPSKGDEKGSADSLIRRYLWRAFSTDWYEKQANSRLYDDFMALKKAMKDKSFEVKATSEGIEETVFDSRLPTWQALKNELWPKSRGIKKRAILAICLRKGAKDIASNEEISDTNIGKREYHHVFPQGLFTKHGDSGSPANRALNCILIEEFTNKSWRKSWPGKYLIERMKNASEKEVRDRLESHLLPTDIVLGAKQDAGDSLKGVYDKFLTVRAKFVAKEMRKLCGEE